MVIPRLESGAKLLTIQCKMWPELQIAQSGQLVAQHAQPEKAS